MKSGFWIIYVVTSTDDVVIDEESAIEAFVGKELIADKEDADIAAFIRGGVLAATVRSTEADAERTRKTVEHEVFGR